MFYLVGLEQNTYAEVLDTTDDTIEKVSLSELQWYISVGVSIKGVEPDGYHIRFPNVKERILSRGLNILVNEISISGNIKKHSGYLYFHDISCVDTIMNLVKAGHLRVRGVSSNCSSQDILRQSKQKGYYLTPVVLTCSSLSYFTTIGVTLLWYENLRIVDLNACDSEVITLSDKEHMLSSGVSFSKKFGNYRFWDLYKLICKDGYAKIYI